MRCNLCGASEEARELVWRKESFDVVRCRSCGLLFRGTIPDRAELELLYGQAYFGLGVRDDEGHGYAGYVQDEPQHRAQARARLRRLERHGAARGRLLDVGAAAGFFLDEARSAGWEVRGIDVSEPMSGWARERLRLDVQTGLFEEGRLEGPFDVVTMWDYLEHSIDPARALAEARRLLKPGGLLALSTGDASSPVARLSGSRWHLLLPAHTFYFSRATLARYLHSAGFDVLETGYPAGRYSVEHAAYKLRTMTGAAPIRRAADLVARSRAGRMGIPLNLWDIVTVHAAARPARVAHG